MLRKGHSGLDKTPAKEERERLRVGEREIRSSSSILDLKDGKLYHGSRWHLANRVLPKARNGTGHPKIERNRSEMQPTSAFSNTADFFLRSVDKRIRCTGC